MVTVVLEKNLYEKHCRLLLDRRGKHCPLAFLLPDGRTVHSTLTIPNETNEASSLTMENDSPREDLVRAAKLIIWDEASMMH